MAKPIVEVWSIYPSLHHRVLRVISFEISINDHIIFIQYVEIFYESIWKELKIFKIKYTNEANVKAIKIDKKNQLRKAGKETCSRKATKIQVMKGSKVGSTLTQLKKFILITTTLTDTSRRSVGNFILHWSRRWKKPKNNDSKKKEKIVLNIVKVEELSILKQVDFKLNLIVRKLEIITEANLEAYEKLFHLKIQIK